MRKKRAIGFLLVLSLFCSKATFAQDESPDPPDCGFGDNPPCEVPLDGGVLFLLAAGAAYGAKKIRDNKQNSADLT